MRWVGSISTSENENLIFSVPRSNNEAALSQPKLGRKFRTEVSQ